MTLDIAGRRHGEQVVGQLPLRPAGSGPPGLAAAATYREVAELFGALADPTRMAIVHALSVRETCTCELAAIVGVTESGVSQHLRILRALRLVKSRRAGKFVYYTLDDAHVAALLELALTHRGHIALASEAASA